MKCSPVHWPWTIEGAHMPKDVGRVMSTFACGGGSSLGYKLAGFDVVAVNEIDERVADVYLRNNQPEHKFLCSIRDLLEADLPPDLFDLDVLDGSPPCTPFSMAGNREEDWSKVKQFSEGQALQRLDDLFFAFIGVAKRLQPKVVVAENVAGLLMGKAKGYVREIFSAFQDAGYDVQAFKLNAALMGVAQARPRTFFIARRRDLVLPRLVLDFQEPVISFRDVVNLVGVDSEPDDVTRLPQGVETKWRRTKVGKNLDCLRNDGNAPIGRKNGDRKRLAWNHPVSTLTTIDTMIHPVKPRYLTPAEWNCVSSFPTDFDWGDLSHSRRRWFMGMSVPPLMMQRVALALAEQWGESFSGSC